MADPLPAAEALGQARKKKREAEDLIRQVERKIDVQMRRNRSNDAKRANEEHTRQRRAEVMQQRQAAQDMIEARRLDEARRHARMRQEEQRRKEDSRQAMYSVFSDKVSQARTSADCWNTSLKASKRENEAYDLYRKENAHEAREENHRRRLRAIETIEESRRQDHEARRREQDLMTRTIEARRLERANAAARIVSETHDAEEKAKQARYAVEQQKREQREKEMRQQTEAEKRELAAATAKLMQLQSLQRRLDTSF